MCPACHGDNVELLGSLRSLSWWRCRDCGMDYHEEATEEPVLEEE